MTAGMKKVAGLAALLCLLVASGCERSTPAAGPAAASAAGFPLTVTDDSGRSVTFAGPPHRIISLAGAHTETLYALGAGERVVAADRYSNYPPDVLPKAKLNCWPRPPLERIVALKPDLVLVLTEGEEFVRQMDSLRIPVLRLFPKTYGKAGENVELLGRVVGAEARGRELAAEMRARAARVEERLRGVPPKRVMFELDAADPARPYVAGSGGFYGELLRMAGGDNVFKDLRAPAAQVSTEQVIARNPEVILLGDTQSPLRPQSPALLKARPGWSAITAVKSGRMFGVDSERITRPGPRLPEGLEEIARKLHPERFE